MATVKKPIPSQATGAPRAPMSSVRREQLVGLAADNDNTRRSGEADKFWSHPLDNDDSASDVRIRWNQQFPYQFIVVKIDSKNGQPIYNAVNGWKFTLPIPPQSLSIQMPFATTLSATLGGVVEENNGAPFRIISMSGTTGVLPGKGSILQGQSFSTNTSGLIAGGNIASDLFTGVISSAQSTVRAAQDTARGLSQSDSTAGFITNVISSADIQSQDLGKTTGFYQFLLLQRFFENYADFKKTHLGRDSVLAFCSWKDSLDSVYLCTPLSFNVQKSADSPYEYQYQIQLKAWRRVRLETNPSVAALSFAEPIRRRPDKVAVALAGLINARRVLQGARNTLLAVRGDIDRALNFLREGVLLLKDIQGVALTAAELPTGIRDQIAKESAVVYQSLSQAVTSPGVAKNGEKMRNLHGQLKSSTGKKVSNARNQTWGNVTRSHPAAGVISGNKPRSANHDTLANIGVKDLDISPATTRRINQEVARVRALTRLDFERNRNELVGVLETFGDSVGAGDDTYDQTYGRTRSPVARTTPTEQDLSVIMALNEAIIHFNELAATSDGETSSRASTVDYVAGLARSRGIAFTTPVSKFAVPFPYGSTLEMVAEQYLGDKDRWHEIATLNGLREPFVDEVGVRMSLTANGNGNQVVVADSSALFAGQPIWLMSTNIFKEKRRITNVETLSATQSIIMLDGEPDLGRFLVADGAVLEAFLPDTVNSQQIIYIPSPDPSGLEDNKTKSIPGLSEFDPMIAVGGVDFLLTDTNDLIVTPDGDNRLATGLANIIQRARIIIGTRQGSLFGHKTFGLPGIVGQSIAEMPAADILRLTQQAFAEDSTFTGVRAASVRVNGGVSKIALSLEVAGVSQLIPVGFQIQR